MRGIISKKGSFDLLVIGCVRGACILYFAAVSLFVTVFAAQKVVIVEGVGGQESYSSSIDEAGLIWENAARAAGHICVVIKGGRHSGQVDQLDELRAELEKVEEPEQESSDLLWLVLIGHGSAQGRAPKFALEGPDLTAEELSKMLRKVRRPAVVVAGFSCGGAFVKPLSAPGRLIVSATRSGVEENWTHFPKFFAEALTGMAADADGDGQVSLFEAWLHAGAQVEGFFKEEGRLLTEHAVLEDTGDGSPMGLNAGKTASSPGEKKVRTKDKILEEGRLARQTYLLPNPVEGMLTSSERLERESLEEEVRALSEQKMHRASEEYQKELEGLLLKLAAIYSRVQLRLGR